MQRWNFSIITSVFSVHMILQVLSIIIDDRLLIMYVIIINVENILLWLISLWKPWHNYFRDILLNRKFKRTAIILNRNIL